MMAACSWMRELVCTLMIVIATSQIAVAARVTLLQAELQDTLLEPETLTRNAASEGAGTPAWLPHARAIVGIARCICHCNRVRSRIAAGILSARRCAGNLIWMR